jgi:hypothetical protein
MTRQDIFNTVATALIAQGEPAKEPLGGACRYRLEEYGRMLKCAVGHLISDEAYDPEMDQTGRASTVISEFGHKLPELEAFMFKREDNSTFLNFVQVAHDQSDWSSAFSTEEDVGVTPGGDRGSVVYENGTWLQRWAHDMRLLARFYDLDASVLDQVPA